MAEQSLSQITPTVKEINPIHMEFLNGEIPAVLSTEVAECFLKKHQHVLRDIDRLRSILPKSFYESNFGQSFREVSTGNGTIRKFPVYLLSRDAFSLLVMGFTGSAAIRWKLKYIEAFNALEAAALTKTTELAREAGYLQGKDEALALPVMEAERKAGYLEGLKEGRKIARKRDGLNMLTRAVKYRKQGLTQGETARLLGVKQQRVSDLLARARKLGVTL